MPLIIMTFSAVIRLLLFLASFLQTGKSQCTSSSRPLFLSSSTGTFTSPNYPLNYGNNANCSWRIYSSNSDVTLTVVDFYTETYNDFVDIYNGYDATYTRLARLYGLLSTRPQYRSTQQYMYVVFFSDYSITHSGFNMTYTTGTSAPPVQPDVGCKANSRPAELTNAVGTISSPDFPTNYPNNADCQWRITSKAYDGMVTLTIKDFHTEACCDFLSIYDGGDKSATLMATLSGSLVTPLRSYTSTLQNLFVRFSSDSSITERGFNITYTITTVDTGTAMACSADTMPRVLTTFTGSFTSLNYPQNYPLDGDCQWRIQSSVPSGIVIIEFNEFITAPNDHTLNIYDGFSSSSTLIASLSGNHSTHTPGDYRSSQIFMFIRFRTLPVSGPAKGFMATYRSSPVVVEWCSPGSAPAEYTGSYGTVKSPKYPGNYPTGSACQWRITASSYNGRVSLVIDDFQTSSGDYLNIYDGQSTSSSSLGQLSGASYSPPLRGYHTTQRYMLLRFTSSFSPRRGFMATYTTSEVMSSTVACSLNEQPSELKSSTGTITSPNYPANYYTNSNCQWLIQAPDSSLVVYIDFNYFYTQATRDFVFLYDGLSSRALLIAKLSGRYTNPPGFRTTQTYLFVHFNSAGNNNQKGFSATYRSSPPAMVECSVDSPPLQLTGSTGTFSSLKYPDNYPASDSYCKWLITSPTADGIVSLVFNDFDTKLLNDYVEVYDGNSIATSLLMRRLAGSVSTPLRGLITTQRHMLLRFYAREFAYYRGFSATYTTSTVDTGDSCSLETKPRRLTSYTGSFTSPHYPRNYDTNSDCQWRIISAEESTVIYLDFQFFSLVPHFDFVNLFDGDGLNAKIITNLTGYYPNPPGGYFTTTNYMYIQFTSSASSTQQGFIATYRPTVRPTDSTTDVPNTNTSLPDWAIAVIVVASVLAVATIIGVPVVRYRKRQAQVEDHAGQQRRDPSPPRRHGRDHGREPSPPRSPGRQSSNAQTQQTRYDCCIICEQNSQDAVIYPCRHATFCMKCAKKILGTSRTCPTCRTYIDYLQQVFR